jgi:hypothetical protein
VSTIEMGANFKTLLESVFKDGVAGVLEALKFEDYFELFDEIRSEDGVGVARK